MNRETPIRDRVQGKLIESCTIGSIVIVRTTAAVYLVHVSSVPAITVFDALRIRELYETGAHTNIAIGRMFDVSENVVQQCVNGTHHLIRGRKLPRSQGPQMRVAGALSNKPDAVRKRARKARETQETQQA